MFIVFIDVFIGLNSSTCKICGLQKIYLFLYCKVNPANYFVVSFLKNCVCDYMYFTMIFHRYGRRTLCGQKMWL